MREEARVTARQQEDGRWLASAEGAEVAAPTVDACIAALRRALPGRALILELLPRLLGVAEAAAYLGWDKRRVITYVDRGSFPEPLASLAGGRIWALDDVRAFRAAFLARRERRARQALPPTPRPPAESRHVAGPRPFDD